VKILVADDSATNRAVLGALLTQMGHQPIFAENGREAVEVFERELPDFILMDVMMPIEDGLSATRRIKALTVGRMTPIIIVTTLDSEPDLIKGIEAGADDYFTKPIKMPVVRAKVNAMQRAIEVQREVEQKTQELEEYYYAAENDMRITSHIMQRMTEPEKLNDPALEYWLQPTAYCSGDLICAARTPGGILHLMLADGTGHGLSAAMDVIPLPQIFYSMTAIAYSISNIAAEMNARIKALLPVDHFIAAVLIAVDPNDKTIEIWNGGNPTCLILNDCGEMVHSARSRHLPIGILQADAFDASTETMRFSSGYRIIAFSDGLPDAGNANGTELGLESILEVFRHTPAQGCMDNLKKLVAAHTLNTRTHDDISVAIVHTDALDSWEDKPSSAQTAMASNALSNGWRIQIRLGAAELQVLDPIPFILDLLKKLQVTDAHLSSLFLIISELFNNALDHGLLQLDSNIKHGEKGFETYLSMRNTRLANLSEEATLELEFENQIADELRLLKIRVRDSGNGFDYLQHVNRYDQENQQHGRGIGLVQKIANQVEYNDRGNEVIVTYSL
jgi:CheY-like chemotaxis protein/anti-sigma regulatory factor (Ser/Thr protein kinase)